MFKLFDKIVDVTVDTVLIPVDVAKDVVTMGGSITEKDEPYTVSKLKKVTRKLDNLTEE